LLPRPWHHGRWWTRLVARVRRARRNPRPAHDRRGVTDACRLVRARSRSAVHRRAADPAMLGVTMEQHPDIGWNLDPILLVPLGVALVVYAVGWRRLAKRASTLPSGTGLFLAGWAVLTLALVSPLHEAGERSFTMHMIEHELIMLGAAL